MNELRDKIEEILEYAGLYENDQTIKNLLSLFTEEMEKIIGEDLRHISDTYQKDAYKADLDSGGSVTADEILFEAQKEISIQNSLRSEQRQKLAKLMEGEEE